MKSGQREDNIVFV